MGTRADTRRYRERREQKYTELSSHDMPYDFSKTPLRDDVLRKMCQNRRRRIDKLMTALIAEEPFRNWRLNKTTTGWRNSKHYERQKNTGRDAVLLSSYAQVAMAFRATCLRKEKKIIVRTVQDCFELQIIIWTASIIHQNDESQQTRNLSALVSTPYAWHIELLAAWPYKDNAASRKILPARSLSQKSDFMPRADARINEIEFNIILCIDVSRFSARDNLNLAI